MSILYLDTFDWSLMKNKLSLRYRISNGQAMYTLKSFGAIEEGIAKRMETEVPLEGPVDAPAEIPVKRIRKLIDGIIFPAQAPGTHPNQYRPSPLPGPFAGGGRNRACLRHFELLPAGASPKRRAQKLYEMEAEILHGSGHSAGISRLFLSAAFGYSPSTASKFEVAIERFKLTLPSKKIAREA